MPTLNGLPTLQPKKRLLAVLDKQDGGELGNYHFFQNQSWVTVPARMRCENPRFWRLGHDGSKTLFRCNCAGSCLPASPKVTDDTFLLSSTNVFARADTYWPSCNVDIQMGNLLGQRSARKVDELFWLIKKMSFLPNSPWVTYPLRGSRVFENVGGSIMRQGTDLLFAPLKYCSCSIQREKFFLDECRKEYAPRPSETRKDRTPVGSSCRTGSKAAR